MVPLRFVIIVLLLVKPVYLLYECAFNGHLVSALSRGATSDDIHAIEIFGRTFSGLAFGMIVLRAKAQLLSDKGIHDINLWRALSIVLAVAIFVFFAQKALVNLAAAQSNAATRQAAQRIAVLFSAHNRSDRPLSVSGFAFDVGSNYERLFLQRWLEPPCSLIRPLRNLFLTKRGSSQHTSPTIAQIEILYIKHTSNSKISSRPNCLMDTAQLTSVCGKHTSLRTQTQRMHTNGCLLNHNNL